MKLMTIKSSEHDSSQNLIFSVGGGQYFEARRVDRGERSIIYVSPQSGCAQGCKMCHLTATKQTKNRDAGTDEIFAQALFAINKSGPLSKTVHFNFMARGEFFASKECRDYGDEVVTRLLELVPSTSLGRVLISTIFPRVFHGQYIDVFKTTSPEIYYSLYSMDAQFRNEWLPGARPGEEGLDALVKWQQARAKIPRVHFAFIRGQNDDIMTIANIAKAIHDRRLRVDFNIVRYNPPTTASEESPDIDLCVLQLKQAFPDSNLQVVNRVGFDVKASCGMFVTSGDIDGDAANSNVLQDR